MNIWSIIVASGSGTRFGGPKQVQQISGTQAVAHSVKPFVADTAGVVLVCNIQDELVGIPDSVITVPGGSTRSESVRAGLSAVPSDATHVLIHDGARPLVVTELIQRVVAELDKGAMAVVPVIPVGDTLREVNGSTVDRSKYVAVQTPQGFSAHELRDAHQSTQDATDDASVMEAAGHAVTTVDGDVQNIKITYPLDIAIAEAIYESR